METTVLLADPSVSESGKNSRLPVFLRGARAVPFLTVVLAGQLTYSAFEAFKGSLIVPLTETLGIRIDQFGILMGWLGIAMFLYVPGGWINNRFTVRSILCAWCTWRFVTGLILFSIPNLSFDVMIVIAASWGVWDAIGWPAVVNGVAFMSQDADKKGRGLAMGLLESIRRGVEFLMNVVVIGALALWSGHTTTVMRGFAIAYTLVLVPLIFALLRRVPKNAVAGDTAGKGESASVEALKGLVAVLIKPRMWLAGLAGLCVYWCYVNLIYSSAPYLSLVFKASDAVAGAFGIFNTGLLGIISGLVAGVLADYLFKSSTRMMGIALLITAIGTLAVRLLPVGDGMMWPAMILLMVMAFGIFMGKAVLLAPVAELNLPEHVNGSAMAVGSFLAYASIFWANPLTAGIIEKHRGNAYVGYHQIFMITLVVALGGSMCAFALDLMNMRVKKRDRQAVGIHAVGDVATSPAEPSTVSLRR